MRRQDFDPWGAVRSGGIPQTTLNYTGQRKDGTGLLYYHARYYDPVLARFISADAVVPGAPDGSMDGVALKPLTVDFHESGFVSGLNAENGQGFWFQHSDQVAPWGPANPQGLNRYSYVQNNPLRYTDPTGHALCEKLAPEFYCALYRLGDAATRFITRQVLRRICPRCETLAAEQAFARGEPVGVIGQYGDFILDPSRIFGNNLQNIHQVGSGRLRRYGRGTTDLPGGESAARDFFRRMTGQDPPGDNTPVRVGDREVIYRSTSQSGVPKVEVIDHTTRFHEIIAFR